MLDQTIPLVQPSRHTLEKRAKDQATGLCWAGVVAIALLVWGIIAYMRVPHDPMPGDGSDGSNGSYGSYEALSPHPLLRGTVPNAIVGHPVSPSWVAGHLHVILDVTAGLSGAIWAFYVISRWHKKDIREGLSVRWDPLDIYFVLGCALIAYLLFEGIVQGLDRFY